MKIKYDDGVLKCESCGGEAIGEDDLYLGNDQAGTAPKGRMNIGGMTAYAADDPILNSPLFYPATALCGTCLLMNVKTVDGPWHEVGVGGQS